MTISMIYCCSKACYRLIEHARDTETKHKTRLLAVLRVEIRRLSYVYRVSMIRALTGLLDISSTLERNVNYPDTIT